MCVARLVLTSESEIECDGVGVNMVLLSEKVIGTFVETEHHITDMKAQLAHLGMTKQTTIGH